MNLRKENESSRLYPHRGGVIRSQSILNLCADGNINVVVILANQPTELPLNDVELETVALADDGLNVAHARLPDRIPPELVSAGGDYRTGEQAWPLAGSIHRPQALAQGRTTAGRKVDGNGTNQ